ncbi:MAG TPA: phage integrase N-terminal SAM-like domain-containing protein, partial [Candidatus Woesebacteria bacterium]|nr:phage integrase N-terminal SAM-like domain-containing protein [Candidatus Woesebacteria bacterium]
MLAQNMYIHHLAALFVIYTQVHHHNQNSEQEIQKAIRSLLEEYNQAQSDNRLPAWENEPASTKLPTLLQQFAKSYQLSQIGVALHKYLLALQTAGRLPATIKNYRSDIGQYLSFISSNSPDQIVQKTEVTHFIEYELTRGSSKSTIQRKLASLGQFFQWLQENGWLTTNQWKSFSAQEFTELLKSAKSVRELTTPVSQVDERPAIWSLPLKNIDVQQYLPKHFANSPIKKIKKAPFFSRIKQAMGAQPLLGYFNLAMGILFLLGTAFLGYQQFFSGADSSQAFPANLTRPNRSLSFQGRLTSSSRTPITSATPMRFRLYDSGPATGSGNMLWDSDSCNIDPDQDGIFSTTLGDACGAEITSDVFTENSNVWLEVQVNSEILNPRQSIKTVAYALNSETLQGYPASASAVESTVVVMRSDGKVVFGNANPILEATGDSFAITAKTLTLETSSGSNGNVIINPDGTGQTLINSNTLIEGYLSAPGATLSATYAGGRALTLKAGPSATGDIMQWQTSVGTPLGVIDKSGNIGIGTTVARASLEIAGTASSSGTLTFKGTTDPKIDILNGENFGLRTSVGGDVGLTERLTVLNSGNVGIGTTAPGAKLAIANTGTANGIILGSDQGTPVNIYHSNSPVDGVLYLSGSRIQLNGNYTTINSTYTSLGSYISNSPIVLGGQNLGFNNDNNNDRMRIKGGIGSENALRFLLSDASTEVFRINSTGTASSSGVLTFRGTTDPKINVLNGENFGIQTSVGGDVGLAERFTILNNGYVGINSTSPSQQLEVGGNVEIANYLYFANGATNYLRFDGSDFLLSNDFLPSANNTYALGSNAARWSAIYGTAIYQGGNQVCDTSGNCSSVGNLWQYANGGISPATPYTSVADFYIGGNATASAKFGLLNVNSGTPTASISAGAAGATFLTASGYLSTTARQNLTLGNSSTYNTTGNILLNPNGTGNVGIGTTNPAYRFHVSGGTLAVDSGSGTDTLRIRDGSITKTVGDYFTWDTGIKLNTGSYNQIIFGTTTPAANGSGLVSSGDMSFWTSGYTNRPMYISSAGNVGIGTTTPTALLDIAGTASSSGTLAFRGTTDPKIDILNGENFSIRTSVGGDVGLTERLTILNGGNVGIGSTAPAQRLDVVGNLQFSGALMPNAQAGTSTYLLTSAGANNPPTWQNPATFISQYDLWSLSSGAIFPKNSTTDLLVGGNSTASAKFGFINVNSGTPTASISGTIGATFLTANGNLSTTNRQSLTLGNSAAYNTTGNILLNPNGTGNVGIGTTNPTSPLQVGSAGSGR